MSLGLALQVVALGLLALLNREWSVALSVAYVMGCQALSGIAKDLTKMSAKSAVKVLVPAGDDSGLFKWVAVLTGSKNALKGAGFFLGGFLLAALGFRGALRGDGGRRAGRVVLVMSDAAAGVDRPGEEEVEVLRHPLEFVRHQPAVARAAALCCGARRVVRRQRADLSRQRARLVGDAGRRFHGAVGDRLRRRAEPLAGVVADGDRRTRARGRRWPARSGSALAGITALIPIGLHFEFHPAVTMLGGLALFGVAFALNSSVHSYLVLAYSEADRVSLSVGFYYMANACGRLLGTLLSGVLYQQAGVAASLWGAVVLAAAAGIGAMFLPPVSASAVSWAGDGRRLIEEWSKWWAL